MNTFDLELHNEDCAALFSRLPDKSVDFILTDIPYELDWNGGAVKSGDFSSRKLLHNKGKENVLHDFSNGIDYDKTFNEFIRVCKKVNCCIFCSNKQIGKIMTWWESRGYSVTLLVWDKPNPIPLGNHVYINNLEFIVYVRGKGATFNNLGYQLQLKTFRYAPPNSKRRIHETEKPIEMLSHLLLLHTKKGDLVLDPYAGSFSTAVACIYTKRKFIGCEISSKYYNKAVERIKTIYQDEN